ncbi:MAG: recombinase family protein [Phycisphaerae bacterium]
MYCSLLLMAANSTAKAISRGACIGFARSFAEGNVPHSNAPIYGLDRLHVAPDGTPQHVIRSLADGRQLMLHPETGEVLREFAADGPRQRNHYMKQKADRVMLIPGEPARLAALGTMFQMRYGLGQSVRSIALHLNDMGVASPTGGRWYQSTVGNLLLHPVYIGLGIRGRKCGGIYNYEVDGEPDPSEATHKELAERKHPKTRRRPRDKWRMQTYEPLKDLLPEDVREGARRAIEEHLDKQASALPAKPNTDRHKQSRYLLKNILRCAQTGWKFSGRISTNRRYYQTQMSANAPSSKNKHLRKMVPAEPLECEVLRQLREALLDGEIIRQAVAETLERMRGDHGEAADVPALQQRVRQLKHQVANLIDRLDPDVAADDPIAMKLRTVERELKDAKRRLADAERTDEKLPCNPASAAERLVAEMRKAVQDLPENPQPADYPRLRALLEVFCAKLEVDRLTMQVRMELAMPRGLVERAVRQDSQKNGGNPGGVLPPVCLVSNEARRVGHETTGPEASCGGLKPFVNLNLPADWFEEAVPLAVVGCRRQVKQRVPCFVCRRAA